MSDYLRTVEINGVKIEVDLRTAKRIDTYKVGDPVKVLVKSYNSYEAHIGVIVGFDEFSNLPTITIAYVKDEYSEAKMKFVSLNKESKDIEVAPLQDHEKAFDFNKAVRTFDRQIEKLKNDIIDIENKKSWFIENYDHYFKFCRNNHS